MTRMNWDRVNRENRAISEANRTFDPEPAARPGKNARKRRNRSRGKRVTEKERALAWHRQNRITA